MSGEQISTNGVPSWQQALHQPLLGRLLRRAVQPGVIALAPAHTIVRRLQRAANGPPLLDRLARYLDDAAESSYPHAPIVHARPVRPDAPALAEVSGAPAKLRPMIENAPVRATAFVGMNSGDTAAGGGDVSTAAAKLRTAVAPQRRAESHTSSATGRATDPAALATITAAQSQPRTTTPAGLGPDARLSGASLIEDAVSRVDTLLPHPTDGAFTQQPINPPAPQGTSNEQVPALVGGISRLATLEEFGTVPRVSAHAADPATGAQQAPAYGVRGVAPPTGIAGVQAAADPDPDIGAAAPSENSRSVSRIVLPPGRHHQRRQEAVPPPITNGDQVAKIASISPDGEAIPTEQTAAQTARSTSSNTLSGAVVPSQPLAQRPVRQVVSHVIARATGDPEASQQSATSGVRSSAMRDNRIAAETAQATASSVTSSTPGRTSAPLVRRAIDSVGGEEDVALAGRPALPSHPIPKSSASAAARASEDVSSTEPRAETEPHPDDTAAGAMPTMPVVRATISERYAAPAMATVPVALAHAVRRYDTPASSPNTLRGVPVLGKLELPASSAHSPAIHPAAAPSATSTRMSHTHPPLMGMPAIPPRAVGRPDRGRAVIHRMPERTDRRRGMRGVPDYTADPSMARARSSQPLVSREAQVDAGPAAALSERTAETAPTVDVAVLSEQVYSLLVQRLIAERERKGW